ncbi:hypothetical protein MesoLjLc_38380 [Mesorhizobium sp. L-8-10]|uniref:hypothetical protein n=1 Tax=unclassified Mesorhizobium TaxID=325217 RepID=UPI001928C3B1|nr:MULTISPECIES: hypothetical protein [unclassified Mesorhizobium]BCH24175.1 hypothetical protein MesoLjLb_39600 [Mesorhizobium sp. L-8-3]BCH31908.1 hypothetical protein MesoLjLc_38380 [Mesorhizobium sp. L-8-10]
MTTTDIHATAEKLAADPRLTDDDLRHTLQNIDGEISRIVSVRKPIPIDILRWRRVVKHARSKRLGM